MFYISQLATGLVIGYRLTHQEKDRCQLKIREAVKELNPTVFSQSYSVDFIKVVNTDGEHLRKLSDNILA